MASIRERPRKNGSIAYQVMWRDGETGVADSQTCDTLEAAELWRRLLDANGQSFARAERVHKEQADQGPTVKELLELHIGQLVDVSTYVRKRYTSAVRLHFTENLGALKARGVEYEDVVRWVKYMEAKGLAAKTIANQHGLLSGAFSTAVRMRIRDSNPTVGIRLPKSVDTEDVMRFISTEEWARITASLKDHYVPFFQFLLGSGLRFSEATALKAADFKLDAVPATVRVTKAWKQDDENGFYVGPPKTRKSRRTVSLAPSTVGHVRPLVEAAGVGLVFKQVRGGAIRSSQAHKIWGPACLAAGYTKGTKPRIHDVRHTHASYMIHAGMDMFQLSHRLGHESVTTTLDRYSHLMPEAHFNGAAMAAKALGSL